MLAASAVDSMLKAKGYVEGTLYTRIDKAANDHVITPDMAAWAHAVRLDANDQRHADNAAALPTEQDAKKVLDFAATLAQIMFVLPSRVARGLQGEA
jgi:predicted membrane chloride channel (bestrophin family)